MNKTTAMRIACGQVREVTAWSSLVHARLQLLDGLLRRARGDALVSMANSDDVSYAIICLEQALGHLSVAHERLRVLDELRYKRVGEPHDC